MKCIFAALMVVSLSACVTTEGSTPEKPAFLTRSVEEMSCRELALSSSVIYVEVSRRNKNIDTEEAAQYGMAVASFIVWPLSLVNLLAGMAGTSTSDLWERYMLEDSVFKNRCVIFPVNWKPKGI